MGLKSVGMPPSCTVISSTPIACRTAAGISRRSSRLEPRNVSGFSRGIGFGIAASIPESVYLYKFLNTRSAGRRCWIIQHQMLTYPRGLELLHLEEMWPQL